MDPTTGSTSVPLHTVPSIIPYHIDSELELELDPNPELAAEEQIPELRLSDPQPLISSYIWSTSASSS
jgi:hypothetical protein